MASSLPFLQLTEDFGGEAFGPIDRAEYRLGTAEENEVRLSEGMGVERHHARIVRKSADTFYLSPVDRGATIWLIRGGAGAPEALSGPTVIRPGDAFALGTPQGIRFRLVLREVAAPRKAADSGDATAEARAKALGQGLAGEAQRRAMAGFVRTLPGRLFQGAKRFVKERTFLSPVWILGTALALSGWTVGAWKCTQEATAVYALDAARQQADDCRTELDICRTGGVATGGTVDLPDLVAKATKDPTWTRSLGWPELSDAARAELERLFAAPEKLYAGWYTGSHSRWREVSEHLVKQGGLPEPVARLVAWTAIDPYLAPPESTSGPEWSVLVGADPSTSACQRGPMRLTWRQAQGLGLDAREDTLLASGEGAAFAGQSLDAIVGRIGSGFNVTRSGAGQPPVSWSTLVAADILRAVVTPTETCFGAPGEDGRDDVAAIARKLGALVGKDAKGLPEVGADNWLSARLARVYALHLKGGAGATLDLDQRALGPAFASAQTTDPAGVALVAERAGRTIARAVAIPCVLVLEGGDAFPEEFGAPPDFDACALLSARAVYRRW